MNNREMTTIWVSSNVIEGIEQLKTHKRETKNDIIERLVKQELARKEASQ